MTYLVLIYIKNLTDVEDVFSPSNDLTRSLNFTLEGEKENTELSRHLNNKNNGQNILRHIQKAYHLRCHHSERLLQLQEPKLTAVRYFSNRINTYDLDTTRKQIDTERYDTSILNRVNNIKTKKEHDNQPKRWAKFTYVSERKQGRYKTFQKYKRKSGLHYQRTT